MNTGTDRKTDISLIKNNEKGVILIEFALSFIVLVVLFFGVVTVGLAVGDYVAIKKAAREGAREATITGSDYAGQVKALQAAWLWGLNTSNLTVGFSQENYGNRVFKICSVKYRTNLFNKTFPMVVGQGNLTDYNIEAKATFGWWDFSQWQ